MDLLGEQEIPNDFQWQMDSAESEVTHPDPEVDAILDRLERSLITQEREIYEKERVALQQRLKDVDRQIQHLKLKHAHINNNSRKCHILQLPVEMTNLIFAYTQGSSYSIGESLRFFGPPESRAEVIVSHVCRQWRSIALDYAGLWTRFRFDATHTKCVPLERFEAYIQRSRRQLVELYLNFDGYEKILEGSCSAKLLALLESTMNCTERWKLFFVMTDADEDALPLLTTLKKLENASVPNLEYFAYLSGRHGIGFFEDLGQTIFMNGAPKLKSITFDLSLAEGVVPPLQNITTLCLEDQSWDLRSFEEVLTWEAFVQMLSLPSLTNLSLLGPLVEEPVLVDTDEPFEVKRLENLRFGRAKYFLLFLPFLKAPLLKSLTIALQDYDVAEGSRELTGFPSLESLYLINNRITAPAWRYIAKSTKSIKYLTLVDMKYDETCYAFLGSDEEFWINLQDVVLNIGGLAEREVEVWNFFMLRRDPRPIVRIHDSVLQVWEARLLDGEEGEEGEEGEAPAPPLYPDQENHSISLAVWADYFPWMELKPDDDDDDDEEPAEGTIP